MVLAKNGFELLVNAYYQAYGLIKKIDASGIFGRIDLLPEIEYFRNGLKEHPVLFQAIIQSETNGNKGEIELSLIRLKLYEIYQMKDWWFEEIESSVNNYTANNDDMTSYRISFQTASDNLFNIVKAILPNVDPSISRNNAIEDIVMIF